MVIGCLKTCFCLKGKGSFMVIRWLKAFFFSKGKGLLYGKSMVVDVFLIEI